MTDKNHEEKAIRALFADAHRSVGAPPPFRALWARASEAIVARRFPSRRLELVGFALAGAFAAILAVTLTVFLSSRQAAAPTVAGLPAELASLAELSRWQGPLDFLLETPGRTSLVTVPALSGEAIPISSMPFAEAPKEDSP